MFKLNSLASVSLSALSLLLLQSCATIAQSESSIPSMGNGTDIVKLGNRPQLVGANIAQFESSPQPFGNGTIRTYVKVNGQNQPQEVGVIITEGALSNLPHEDTELTLSLPKQAAFTALDHIGFNWLPYGHMPNPIYGTPHFDIHAYTITSEEREAITMTGDDADKIYKAPDPSLIPAGYVLAPDSAEPRMGSHWVNTVSEEFQGHPHGFSHTLIYGFYNGEMAFIEPMIALDFLNSRQTFEGEFTRPERYTKDGLYPSQYRIAYNENTQEHVITLTGFIQP